EKLILIFNFIKVATGKLLTRWHAHYRSVTCLTISKDESLLISGMFDDMAKSSAGDLYRYSFSEHALRVTDVVTGHGLCNSIVISSSEDRTCKIWSLSEGLLLRSITFPSIIDAIVMDPGEHMFYAGGRDGKIYISVLNAECNRNSIYGMFIIGALYDHRSQYALYLVSRSTLYMYIFTNNCVLCVLANFYEETILCI
ncbi:hypothetical protein BHM03_00025708, partial [Ensete ventricosum]